MAAFRHMLSVALVMICCMLQLTDGYLVLHRSKLASIQRSKASMSSLTSSKFTSTRLMAQLDSNHLNHLTASQLRPKASALHAVSPSISAVGKLMSTCGIGMYYSKIGVIDKSVLSVLSKLIFNLFQPCLLFVNIASTVAKLGSQGSAVWFLPLAALGQVLLGMLVGNVVSLFLYGPKPSDDKSHFIMCTTFANSGPLPMVFVDAILKSHKNSALLPQAVGFISLYLLGWSPLFWILGPGILAPIKPAGDATADRASALKETLKRVLSPPVIGSIFGVLVGAIPFLRNLFIKDSGLMNPIFESMKTLGSAYIPCVLLVLAGSLLPSPDSSTNKSETPANETEVFDRVKYSKQVGAIYLSRFLLMPMVTMAIVPIIKRRFPGPVSELLSDPALLLVLFLEACMPSAQNGTVILTLRGDRAGSAKIARVLMAVYILGIPALSFWLSRVISATGINQ